ncbi:pfs domain protein [Diplodia corticola]|uniref:Pfs domain protein n=1 Tax=Diplodia corticola TaxID=236234 RepID=A0A1J9RUP1_9PEZI|nr:pfs domain protein [Diplodia corticola]OJD31221.1 pfs domain protein [Diplodia corticola]
MSGVEGGSAAEYLSGAAFQPLERVSITTKKKGLSRRRILTITRGRPLGRSWEYQLENSTGTLYEDGKWIPQEDLGKRVGNSQSDQVFKPAKKIDKTSTSSRRSISPNSLLYSIDIGSLADGSTDGSSKLIVTGLASFLVSKIDAGVINGYPIQWIGQLRVAPLLKHFARELDQEGGFQELPFEFMSFVSVSYLSIANAFMDRLKAVHVNSSASKLEEDSKLTFPSAFHQKQRNEPKEQHNITGSEEEVESKAPERRKEKEHSKHPTQEDKYRADDYGETKNEEQADIAANENNEGNAELTRASKYLEFLVHTNAFQWLLLGIKEAILSVHEGMLVRYYSVTYVVNWDPITFLRTQGYQDTPGQAMMPAVTLTGDTVDGQALTCAEYLKQTWLNEYVLDAICATVEMEPGKRLRHYSMDGTEIIISMRMGNIFATVSASNEEAVVEVAQQFAWIASALRTSASDTTASFCTPYIRFLRDRYPYGTIPSYEIDFEVEAMKEPLDHVNGQCWHNLFKNPVIVRGFPIRIREKMETGLELPLNIMAGLAQARRVTTFGDRLFIKGFSTMLVPTRKVGDLMTWHLIYNSDGWASVVRSHIGAPEANYDIRWSGLKGPHSNYALEKVSISVGKIATVGGTFAIGNKDVPIHLKMDGSYAEQVEHISHNFVLLCDAGDERAWLADGASALLHLVRTSLFRDRTGRRSSEFLFNLGDMKDAEHISPARYAISVLTDRHNKALKLFPDGEKETHEWEATDYGMISRVTKKEPTYTLFQDRVECQMHILEQILEHQTGASVPGKRLRLTLRKYLGGYDFMDVATSLNPLCPRVKPIDDAGKGWMDFVKSIQAVTLFARGFGELVEPFEGSNTLCKHWKEVPTGKYYLVVCISDLKEILERRGDESSSQVRLVDNTLWHKSDKLFEPCHCNAGSQHCDRVQVLLPESILSQKFRPAQHPGDWKQPGAVLFGSLTYRSIRSNNGDPEEVVSKGKTMRNSGMVSSLKAPASATRTNGKEHERVDDGDVYCEVSGGIAEVKTV